MSLEEFAAAYGLPIVSRACPNCGETFATSEILPNKKWAILAAPLHACGKRHRLRVMVPKNLAQREQNKRSARDLSAYLAKAVSGGKDEG